MDAADAALVLAIVAAAAALQGAVGFGANLVAVPVVVLVEPDLVPGPMLVMAIVLTGLMAVRDAEGLRFRELGWAYAGRVPGTLVGAAALALVPAADLQLFFGLLVLAAVAMSFTGLALRPSGPVLASAGLLSGFMGTAVSIGGPPMALAHQRASGPELRGTLARFLSLGSSFSLLVLAVAGEYGTDDLVPSLVLVPAAVAGFLLSSRLAPVLDRGYTRPAVLTLSAAAAVGVLVRALW